MAIPVQHSLSGFVRGLCFPFLGLRFVSENPTLWSTLLLPTLLNGLLTALCLAGLGYGAWELSAFAREWFPQQIWWAWVLRAFVYVGLVLLTGALVLGISSLLAAVLTSHFRGVLATRAEKLLGTPDSDLPGLSVAREISEAVLAFAEICLRALLLMFLSWVPAAGPVVAFGLGWYWNAYTLGLESLDTPWALRGLDRAAKKKLARVYRGETLGIGTVALAVGWVPWVGSFVMNLAVVGSVLWYFDELARQAGKR